MEKLSAEEAAEVARRLAAGEPPALAATDDERARAEAVVREHVALPVLRGEPLYVTALLDDDDLARVDRLARARGVTRDEMLAALIAIGIAHEASWPRVATELHAVTSEPVNDHSPESRMQRAPEYGREATMTTEETDER